MKVEYDPVRDLLYLAFEPGAKAAKTVTVTPGVHADFDAQGKLIGLEVIDASEVVGRKMAQLGRERRPGRSGRHPFIAPRPVNLKAMLKALLPIWPGLTADRHGYVRTALRIVLK